MDADKLRPCKHCNKPPRAFDDYGHVGIACYTNDTTWCNVNHVSHPVEAQAEKLWNDKQLHSHN